MPTALDIGISVSGVSTVRDGISSITSSAKALADIPRADLTPKVDTANVLSKLKEAQAAANERSMAGGAGNLDYKQAEWQRHYDRMFGIKKSGGDRMEVLSASEAKAEETSLASSLGWREKEWQRHYDKLLNIRRSQRLTQADFMTADEAARAGIQPRRTLGDLPRPTVPQTSQDGGMSLRREFVAGQAIQRSITSALGVDNGVTRTLDGFERIQYLAQASNLSVGSLIAKLGPMAAATASVAYAWKVGNDELDKANKQLAAMGMKSIGFFQWAGLGLGILKASEVVQVDPYRMAVKTIAEMNRGLDEAKRLEAAIAGNVNMTRTQRESALTAIRQDIALQQELLNVTKQLAALQTRPINPVTSKIAADEKEIERINRVKGLQKELSELQGNPERFQAQTVKELDDQLAAARAAQNQNLSLYERRIFELETLKKDKPELSETIDESIAAYRGAQNEAGEASLRAQIEIVQLERQRKQLVESELETEARKIQSKQQDRADDAAAIARGGARFSKAETFGSEAYVISQQLLGTKSNNASSRQEEILEKQLTEAQAMVQSLDAIKNDLRGREVVRVPVDG